MQICLSHDIKENGTEHIARFQYKKLNVATRNSGALASHCQDRRQTKAYRLQEIMVNQDYQILSYRLGLYFHTTVL